ncbi:MAG: type II secretion system F family protein [Alkalibacterium sp.]|nr:type II secretion system F family protein [Alkalibacterium sp.]
MGIFQKKPISGTSLRTSNHLYKQGVFLNRMGRLLSEGFSMNESLHFLQTLSKSDSASWVTIIRNEVTEGSSLSAALHKCGFPDQTCTQLYFALYHGNFAQAITRSGKQLVKQSEKRKKAAGIIQYPLMLIGFIIIMLFTMRYVLIPHIEQITSIQSQEMPLSTRVIVKMVYHSPIGMLIVGCLAVIGWIVINIVNSNRTPVEKWNGVSKWIKSPLLKLYWSQYFSYEWGQLIKGSCSLLEVVTIMKSKQSSDLVREIGHCIEQEMLKGKSFSDALESFAFLNDEIKEVVRQGETSGKLGYELELYSFSCEEDFDRKIEQLMTWIQPIVFTGVALLIVAIYAALMLPTFSIMDTL